MKTIKRDYNYYLFCFFFTSILCWILEMIYSLLFRNKFVLPGSFYGPYCPIYGSTFVLLLLVFKRKDNILLLMYIIAGCAVHLVNGIDLAGTCDKC